MEATALSSDTERRGRHIHITLLLIHYTILATGSLQGDMIE